MSTYYEEHQNDPKKWILHDGTRVSDVGLKTMFFGKIPKLQVRKLLNITKIPKV